jgi:hypothetical protein
MPRTTYRTAACAIAAQAAVEAYLDVADQPPEFGIPLEIVITPIYVGRYDVPGGVVIEHEGDLPPQAVEAARRAVEAQGMVLVTDRFTWAWEVRP